MSNGKSSPGFSKVLYLQPGWWKSEQKINCSHIFLLQFCITLVLNLLFHFIIWGFFANSEQFFSFQTDFIWFKSKQWEQEQHGDHISVIKSKWYQRTYAYKMVTWGPSCTLYAFMRSSGSTLGPSRESWFCSSVRTVSSMLRSRREQVQWSERIKDFTEYKGNE